MSGLEAERPDFAGIAHDSIHALYALGARLEDRGHDDSFELVLVLVGRAVTDALLLVAHELREHRPAVGEVADAVDELRGEVHSIGSAVTDAS